MNAPKMTQETLLAYLRDEPGDVVLSQWMDQMLAATDDLRGCVGIEPEPQPAMPSPRKLAALGTMWTRLIDESNADRCAHVVDRALQPTVIDPVARRQMCGRCWSEYDWQPLAADLSIREARTLSCDCCESRFSRRWDDRDTGTEGIWTETRRWWHFIAPLRLCWACHRLLNFTNEGLPVEIRNHIAENGDGR